MSARTRLLACALPLSFLLVSCGFLSFERLELSSNLGEDEETLFEDALCIDFSVKPDRQSVEGALSLRNEDSTIDFDCAWSGKRLSVTPRSGWIKGSKYSCSLKGDLRMVDGRKYYAEFSRIFYYFDPAEDIVVMSSSPAAEATVGRYEPIVIGFSKPVDISSFMDHFAIYPDRDVKTVFSDDRRTATMIPSSGWLINTVYTWSLDELQAEDGFILGKASTSRFRTVESFDFPWVAEVCPAVPSGATYSYLSVPVDGAVLNEDPLAVVFSVPMDLPSAISALTIEPSLKGYCAVDPARDDRIVFIPQEPYAIQTRYRLEVGATAKNAEGLAMREPYETFFTSGNVWLRVTSITLDNGPDISGSLGQDPIPEYTMIPPLPGEEYEIAVTVSFSSSIEVSRRTAAVNAIRVAAFFPATADSPYLTMANWQPDGTRVTLTWRHFTASSANVSDYYTITVPGGESGVTNGRGEYMEEGLCAYFKVS